MRRVHPEIQHRARQLRRDQTPAEATLWAQLRNRRLNGIKFCRQHPIGPFITDFCCPQHKLVIEIDGGWHLDRQEYDLQRSQWLTEQGYSIIRFTNQEVRYQLEDVSFVIQQGCKGDLDLREEP